MVRLVLLLAALSSAPTEASQATADHRVESRDVEVILVGERAARDAAHEVLQELLGALHVEVERHDTVQLEAITVVDHGPSTRRLATVIVDLRDHPAWVYVIDGEFERVLARPVRVDAGFDEIAREEVGAIVAEAVDALLRGGAIGVHRDEFVGERTIGRPRPPGTEATPSSATQPSPTTQPSPRAEPSTEPSPATEPPAASPSEPPRSDRFDVELAYRLSTRGPGTLHHALSAGGVVALSSSERASLRLSAHVEGWLPSSAGPPASAVTIAGLMPWAGAGVELRASPRVSVVAEAGLGLGVLHVRSVASSDAAWHPVPLLMGRTAIVVALPRGARLGVGARLLVDPVDVRVLDRRDGHVLFDPLRVWPAVAVVLGWGFDRRRTNRQGR